MRNDYTRGGALSDDEDYVPPRRADRDLDQTLDWRGLLGGQPRSTFEQRGDPLRSFIGRLTRPRFYALIGGLGLLLALLLGVLYLAVTSSAQPAPVDPASIIVQPPTPEQLQQQPASVAMIQPAPAEVLGSEPPTELPAPAGQSVWFWDYPLGNPTMVMLPDGYHLSAKCPSMPGLVYIVGAADAGPYGGFIEYSVTDQPPEVWASLPDADPALCNQQPPQPPQP